MKKLYTAIILSSCAMYATAQSPCTPPLVETYFSTDPAKINREANKELITQQGNPGHPKVGLYRSQERLDIVIDKEKKAGGICVTKIKIGLGLGHVIDIASNYAPESCVYKFAERHERTHERIQAQKLQEANAYLKTALSANPIFIQGSDLNVAFKAWQGKMGDYISTVYENFVAPAQMEFDNSGESERLASECGLVE